MSREVQEMFSDIAPAYDRTNTVLSLGVHHAWRRKAVKQSQAAPGQRVLDVACGTGDLSLAFRKRVGDGHVVGTDFAGPMLHAAAPKARRKGATIDWVQGDCMQLPFPDNHFDVASISFGIRNVDDPVQGMRDMARTVKPGGKVVVLEFGQPRGPIGVPYRFYSKHIMPRIGGLLTGNRAAYEYLPETAAAFPCGQHFLEWMREAGLVDATATRLTGGIAWLYVASVA